LNQEHNALIANSQSTLMG